MRQGGDVVSEGCSHCVTMREHISALGHDLGANAADEAAQVLVLLVNIDRLHYEAVTEVADER